MKRFAILLPADTFAVTFKMKEVRRDYAIPQKKCVIVPKI
jgi:hypothetical protein